MKTDKFTLFVYCNFFVLLSTIVFSQNINKQNVNIADETLTDYSFFSRYNYTKIKKLFEKTISNSSLNSHACWDTLYSVVYTEGGSILIFPTGIECIFSICTAYTKNKYFCETTSISLQVTNTGFRIVVLIYKKCYIYEFIHIPSDHSGVVKIAPDTHTYRLLKEN